MNAGRRIQAALTMPLVLLALVSCARKESKLMLEPGRALGTVLAGEAAQAAGSKKSVVLILPKWAANATAAESFEAALKKQGVRVAFSLLADVGSPMGRGGVGLKSADFFKALEKGGSAGAIVSMAGPPLLTAQEMARLNPNDPPVLVVATRSLGYGPLGSVLGVPADQNYLLGLLDAKVVQLAIVDGQSGQDAKAGSKMNGTREVFFQHYSILRSHG